MLPNLGLQSLDFESKKEGSIEDTDLPKMQKNEEQNFVGISFINGRVSGREKRGGERGRKFLEKKMKWRENLPWSLGCLT